MPRPGQTIGDIEIDWHLEHIRQTRRALPDGALTALSRQARELLFFEWQVLEPGRAPMTYGAERPALSRSTHLGSDADAAWFREILDRLWRDRYPERADRLRVIVEAILAEAQSLRAELGARASGEETQRIEATIALHVATMRRRAGDRAQDPDADRTLRELTDKLRVLVHVDLLAAMRSEPATFGSEDGARAIQDDRVRAAWVRCGYGPETVPPLGSGCGDPDVVGPEMVGRDPVRHLSLMLDPAGPVDARPMPATLRDALRTPAEPAAIRRIVDAEVRRAAFPAGLADESVRAHWFLVVLYARSRWTAGKVMTEAQHCADPDLVPALRRLGRAEPAPGALDRVRGAALLQDAAVASAAEQPAGSAPARAPTGYSRGTEEAAAPTDSDGWLPPVARVAFEDAPSSRFAVPMDVARETAAITTCGVLLPRYFGANKKDRDHRFGRLGLEKLCERASSEFLRKIHQRLLKDDQLGTGVLRRTTPTEWHSVTTRQMRREAANAVRRYRAARPLIDQEPNGGTHNGDESDVDQSDALSAANILDDDVLELLQVGPRAADVLAGVITHWVAARHSRIGVARHRRLTELQLFGEWLPGELSRHGPDADDAAPVLQGARVPLRQALHRFVLTGGHLREPRTIPRSPAALDGGTDASTVVTRADARAQQRASKAMFEAVIEMLVELKRLPRRAATR